MSDLSFSLLCFNVDKSQKEEIQNYISKSNSDLCFFQEVLTVELNPKQNRDARLNDILMTEYDYIFLQEDQKSGSAGSKPCSCLFYRTSKFSAVRNEDQLLYGLDEREYTDENKPDIMKEFEKTLIHDGCDSLKKRASVVVLQYKVSSDNSNRRIIVVSFHNPSKKGSHVKLAKQFFKAVNYLGEVTGYPVVVAGDFNCELLKNVDTNGFIVPPYDPTIRRAFTGHSSDQCIDFFAYKNYNEYTEIQVKNVQADLVMPPSDGCVIKGTDGQYYLDEEEYKDLKKKNKISDHDPLKATLTVKCVLPTLTISYYNNEFPIEECRSDLILLHNVSTKKEKAGYVSFMSQSNNILYNAFKFSGDLLISEKKGQKFHFNFFIINYHEIRNLKILIVFITKSVNGQNDTGNESDNEDDVDEWDSEFDNEDDVDKSDNEDDVDLESDNEDDVDKSDNEDDTNCTKTKEWFMKVLETHRVEKSCDSVIVMGDFYSKELLAGLPFVGKQYELPPFGTLEDADKFFIAYMKEMPISCGRVTQIRNLITNFKIKIHKRQDTYVAIHHHKARVNFEILNSHINALYFNMQNTRDKDIQQLIQAYLTSINPKPDLFILVQPCWEEIQLKNILDQPIYKTCCESTFVYNINIFQLVCELELEIKGVKACIFKCLKIVGNPEVIIATITENTGDCSYFKFFNIVFPKYPILIAGDEMQTGKESGYESYLSNLPILRKLEDARRVQKIQKYNFAYKSSERTCIELKDVHAKTVKPYPGLVTGSKNYNIDYQQGICKLPKPLTKHDPVRATIVIKLKLPQDIAPISTVPTSTTSTGTPISTTSADTSISTTSASTSISTTSAGTPISTTSAGTSISTTSTGTPISTTSAGTPISTTSAGTPISTTSAGTPISTTSAGTPKYSSSNS